jgi:hypothetical protein
MTDKVSPLFAPDETPTIVETPHPTLAPPPVPAAPAADPVFNGIALANYREAAAALLGYAVNLPHGTGRSTADPVYRRIVEGRVGSNYSSCGDLAHWFLYRLGVRAPWINRAENGPNGRGGWRVGANLNALVAPPVGPCAQAFAPRKLAPGLPQLAAGDVIVMSNKYGGHVICIRDFDAATGLTHTSEYGQPGGMPRTRTLKIIGGSLFADSNQVISILRLDHALGAPGLAGIDNAAVAQAVSAVLGG